MADVAARAGVSKKTVSAVVNGVGQVSAATRNRVEVAVAELDYLPNPAARRLSSARAGAITLMLPNLGSGDQAALAAAVIAAGEQAGITVLCQPVGGTEQRIADFRLAAGTSDGALLLPPSAHPVVPEGDPLLVLGHRFTELAVDHVIASAARAISTAAELLGPDDRVLVLASRDDADLVPAPWSDTLLAADSGSAQAGFVAAERAMSGGGDPPRAIVAVGSGLAVGAAHAVIASGRMLPRDVRLVRVGYGEEPEYYVPSITTVGADLPLLAATAVSQLQERVGGYRGEPRVTEVPLVVVRREST